MELSIAPVICRLEYPGHVINDQRALATLGGEVYVGDILRSSRETVPPRWLRRACPHCASSDSRDPLRTF